RSFILSAVHYAIPAKRGWFHYWWACGAPQNLQWPEQDILLWEPGAILFALWVQQPANHHSDSGSIEGRFLWVRQQWRPNTHIRSRHWRSRWKRKYCEDAIPGKRHSGHQDRFIRSYSRQLYSPN